jgi:hypothetical protein
MIHLKGRFNTPGKLVLLPLPLLLRLLAAACSPTAPLLLTTGVVLE